MWVAKTVILTENENEEINLILGFAYCIQLHRKALGKGTETIEFLHPNTRYGLNGSLDDAFQPWVATCLIVGKL